MTVSLPTLNSPAYAVSPRVLRRWADQRLRRERRADGGDVYTFALSGSTCNSRPLELIMTVAVDARGRIESATARPAPADTGCDGMCAASGNGQAYLAEFGHCAEAVGLTLYAAAFRDWQVEPSGCLCTAGHRRHKWRNLFQTLHLATTVGGPA